jgi:hypothetical protein
MYWPPWAPDVKTIKSAWSEGYYEGNLTHPSSEKHMMLSVHLCLVPGMKLLHPNIMFRAWLHESWSLGILDSVLNIQGIENSPLKR